MISATVVDISEVQRGLSRHSWDLNVGQTTLDVIQGFVGVN